MPNSNHTESAIAHLGLMLTNESQTIGAQPSDEDLAALYENRIEESRRREVLSHLANNSVHYARWMRCLETQSQMDALATVAVKKVRQPSMLDTISEWLSSLVGSPMGLVSSAVAAILVVTVVLSIIPMGTKLDTRETFDLAYRDWPAQMQRQWDTSQWANKAPPLGTRSMEMAVEKSVNRQIIETGFKRSVDSFSTEIFEILGIAADNLTSIPYSEQLNIGKDQYQHLVDLGQISAMVAMQCKLDKNNLRLSNIQTSVSQLVNEISKEAGAEVKQLLSNSNKPSGLAMCQLAFDIFDLVKAP